MSMWVCALDGSASSAVRYGPSMSSAGALTSSFHESMHLSRSACLFLRALAVSESFARSDSDRARPSHAIASACSPAFWRALACCPHASAEACHRPFITAAFSRHSSAASSPASPASRSILLPHDRYASAHFLRSPASSPPAARASCPSRTAARLMASAAVSPFAPPAAMRGEPRARL